jgi:hypothetical protein
MLYKPLWLVAMKKKENVPSPPFWKSGDGSLYNAPHFGKGGLKYVPPLQMGT